MQRAATVKLEIENDGVQYYSGIHTVASAAAPHICNIKAYICWYERGFYIHWGLYRLWGLKTTTSQIVEIFGSGCQTKICYWFSNKLLYNCSRSSTREVKRIQTQQHHCLFDDGRHDTSNDDWKKARSRDRAILPWRQHLITSSGYYMAALLATYCYYMAALLATFCT